MTWTVMVAALGAACDLDFPEGVFVASADGQTARSIRQDRLMMMTSNRIVSGIERRLTRVLDRWRTTRNEDDVSDDEPLLPAYAEVPPRELVRVLSQNEHKDRRPAPKKPLCARSPGGLELHADPVAIHERANNCFQCRPSIGDSRSAARSICDTRKLIANGILRVARSRRMRSSGTCKTNFIDTSHASQSQVTFERANGAVTRGPWCARAFTATGALAAHDAFALMFFDDVELGFDDLVGHVEAGITAA